MIVEPLRETFFLIIEYRVRKQLEFQLFLWASSCRILLFQGHFLLVLVIVSRLCFS